MEKEEDKFEVEFTPTARVFFFELVEYLFAHYSFEKAENLSDNLLEKALSLNKLYDRGALEPYLKKRKHEYRFLIFERTKRKKVKIIYYVNEKLKKIYITVFFQQRKIIKVSLTEILDIITDSPPQIPADIYTWSSIYPFLQWLHF